MLRHLTSLAGAALCASAADAVDARRLLDDTGLRYDPADLTYCWDDELVENAQQRGIGVTYTLSGCGRTVRSAAAGPAARA